MRTFIVIALQFPYSAGSLSCDIINHAKIWRPQATVPLFKKH